MSAAPGRRTTRALWVGCWIVAGAGCTPLGAWVYSDPALEVSRVRMSSAASSPSPVMVSLAVRNPNDYEISADRFELALLLDSVPVGRYEGDGALPLARAGSAELALPLVLDPGATPDRLELWGHGERRFSVTGRARFRTPFGVRMVRFAGQGTIVFGDG